LTLHESTAHTLMSAMEAPSATARDSRAVNSARPRRVRAVALAAVTAVALVVAALVLGAGARAAYRSIAKTVAARAGKHDSTPGPSQPAPQPAQHPAPAASHALPVAGSSGALAAARQKYQAVAASYGAAMAHTSEGTPLSAHVWAEYAAALRSYDAGLRAIAFPAAVQPYVTALLADDAQMETWFDRLAGDPGCSCSAAISLKPKIAADVDRLRSALGMPPAGASSSEPGH
jgi:hypothetical protein